MTHTVKVIAGGFVLLAVCLLIGRLAGGPAPAAGVASGARLFIPLWLGGNGRASVAFMHPSHPSAPPGPEVFTGTGMCLEFQVADAAAAYARFQDGGAPIRLTLRDEPFGQRRFGLFDPAGVWIDVVEQVEPAPGWWDRYLPKPADS